MASEIEKAREVYRTMWDCEDSTSIDVLMADVIDAYTHEHERFRARGAELDDKDQQIERLNARIRELEGALGTTEREEELASWITQQEERLERLSDAVGARAMGVSDGD